MARRWSPMPSSSGAARPSASSPRAGSATCSRSRGRTARISTASTCPPSRDPLVPRHLRLEVTERMDAEGNVLTPLAPDEVPALVAELRRRRGSRASRSACCTPTPTPRTSRRSRHLLAPHFRHVSVSSEINAEFREYERACTTVLNASVMPLATAYLDDLRARLPGGLRAAPPALGGRHDVGRGGEGASAHDGHVGPGGRRRRRRAHRAHARHRPRARLRHGRHHDRRVPDRRRRAGDGGAAEARRLPGAAAHAGRRVDRRGRRLHRARGGGAGALKVGPDSAGAVPGPACYGLGGTRADGDRRQRGPRLPESRPRLRRLDPPRPRPRGGGARAARAALRPLAHRRPRTASWRSPTRTCCARCGSSPCSAATTCATSRSSPTAARDRCTRARSRGRRGSSRVVVPAHSGAFSALGCLVSPLRYDAVQTYRARARRAGIRRWSRTASARSSSSAWRRSPKEGHRARSDARARAASTCATRDRTTRSTVPFGDGGLPALRAAFEQRHRQLYGYATGESIECVNLRVAAIGVDDRAATPPSGAPASARAAAMPAGSHRAFFPETGEVDAAAATTARRCPSASRSRDPP